MTARLLSILCALLLVVTSAEAGPQKNRYAIRAGLVLTMAGEPIPDGVVVVEKGKIVAVGEWGKVKIPKGTYLIEAENRWLMPGFIELHCHVGAGRGWGDLNDSVHQVNPELRNLDVILPGNELLRNAMQGGVTSALFIPGSGSNMSGFGTVIKMYGETPKETVLRFPGALKIAQAGNPERWGGDLGKGRMGMNLMIRKTLEEGRDYAAQWAAYKNRRGPKPQKIARLEYLRGLFEKRYPIIVHTQMMQVMHSTIRMLHDDLKLRPILSHGTFDSFKNAPMMKTRRKLHLNLGPRQIYHDRRRRAIYSVVERWWAGGARNMSVCTDSPVLLQEDLFYQGTIAGHFGAPIRPLLEGLTIGAARGLMVDHRVGSLEVGKDADMVLWTGDPFDPRSRVLTTFIDGRRVYDLARDRGRY